MMSPGAWQLLLVLQITVMATPPLKQVRHSATVTGSLSLDGCPDHVQWKDAAFPNALEPDQPSYVFWLKSLFTTTEAKALVHILKDISFETEADSTDHLPTYELYLTGNHPGTVQASERLEMLRELVLPRFEECVAPFVQKKFNCPSCTPCISLIRRYRRDERDTVIAHRDGRGIVTVVVELQPAQPIPKAGGLFIQKSEDAQTNFVPMKAGDAFLHNYELLHGVQVACSPDDQNCARYSLIMWFREDEATCQTGGVIEAQTELYSRSALAGIAEGRYSWARHALQISHDGFYEIVVLPKNATSVERTNVVEEVLGFLKAAVTEQDHADSALFLAELHLEGVPGALAPSAVSAADWRKKARKLGSSQLAGWEKLRGEKLDEALMDSLQRGSENGQGWQSFVAGVGTTTIVAGVLWLLVGGGKGRVTSSQKAEASRRGERKQKGKK